MKPILKYFIMMICLLVFIGSAAYIADYFYQSYEIQAKQEERSLKFHSASIGERFNPLLEINPDTIGWIRIPGTKCDNVVVKGKDNEKYLDTTFEGEKSKYGAIFAEAACTIRKPDDVVIDPETGKPVTSKTEVR